MAEIKKDDNIGSHSGSHLENPGGGRTSDSAREAMNRAYDETRHRGEHMSEEARRRGEEYAQAGRRYADEARERGERYYEEALHRGREYYEEARHRGADYLHRGEDYYREGYERTSHFVRENPLLIGVLGLAAGLAIGALLPRSRQEDETLGRYSDDLRERGKDYAREAVHRGRDYAHEAFSRMEEGHPTHESEWRGERSEESEAARRSSPLDTQRRH